MHRSEIDLLSSVLDAPEFFWEATDNVQELYRKVCEYMELEDRINAVNSRLEVCNNLLDGYLTFDHQQHSDADAAPHRNWRHLQVNAWRHG